MHLVSGGNRWDIAVLLCSIVVIGTGHFVRKNDRRSWGLCPSWGGCSLIRFNLSPRCGMLRSDRYFPVGKAENHEKEERETEELD
jgi:hypothetical protein